MTNKKAIEEVRRHVHEAAPRGLDTSATARYVGSVGHEKRAKDEQSRLKFLGLSLPEIHALAKAEYSFSSRPVAEQVRLWAEIFHAAKTFDEQTVAISWLANRKRRAQVLAHTDLLFDLQASVDNWASSDSVADLLAHAVELDHGNYARLAKWTTSKHPWERRQSVVGLYYYARLRKKHLPIAKALALIEPLLDDPHYFVQKGVGWALREAYQVDRERQTKFLLKHLHRISGVAFAAAAEKHPPLERKKLISLRASKRKTARIMK